MASPNEPLALIAGSTQMPLLVARGARAAGREVVAAAIHGITDPRLDAEVDSATWLEWGNLPAFFELLRHWQGRGITEAIMAGKVEQQRMYERAEGDEISAMLDDLPTGHTDQLLGAVANALETAGLRLLESTRYLQDLIMPAGRVAGRDPTAREAMDIDHGWMVAKRLGELDIGQTVVVKDRAVVAVEGMEGTDACIRRAGELAGAGCVVVKVAKPEQDLRFDVPVIGAETLASLASASASALAIEAGVTVVFDRPEVDARASELDIAIVAKADA